MAVDSKDYEKQWPGLPIHYLILAGTEYVVFLDDEHDIDWQITDALSDRISKLNPTEKAKYHKIVNEAASIESIPCGDLEVKSVINFKRQIGEALVRNFEFDFISAQNMLKLARGYIVDRNSEKSRYLYLKASGVTCIISFGLLVLSWCLRVFIKQVIGIEAFVLFLCFLLGAVGAFLSIVLRLGNTNLDFHASKKLHYMEGTVKIIAGMFSALLIGFCIKAGILVPIFSKIQSTHLAMCVGGFIAGSSERLAPSIIKKIAGSKNSKDEA